jgi:2Fe-2S ferredoxin
MVEVVFVDAVGVRRSVTARDGDTLMEAAIEHEVPSIVGFCGGMCACATCHCYVAGDWAAKLPPPDDNERDTLRRALDVKPASRLACQIRLSAALDGLTVELPAHQRTP